MPTRSSDPVSTSIAVIARKVIEEIKHFLSKHRAPEHRVVRTAESDLRNLHDLLAEWPLLVIELIHRELRKALFFTHGVL